VLDYAKYITLQSKQNNSELLFLTYRV